MQGERETQPPNGQWLGVFQKEMKWDGWESFLQGLFKNDSAFL